MYDEAERSRIRRRRDKEGAKTRSMMIESTPILPDAPCASCGAKPAKRCVEGLGRITYRCADCWPKLVG